MTALVEGILQQLGNPGGYQILVVALLCSNYFPIVFHQLSVIFYTEVPPHNCRLPEGWPWHKQFSIPKVSVNGQSRYDQCRMFVDPNRAKIGTKPCVYGWEFHPENREWTVVAEWGLVCEREYLVSLASMVYYGGVMFGGLVFGTLADKFGRKPIVLFTLYCQTIVSVGIYFVQNFILFVILRFFHGLLLQGLQCTTFCLVMEQMSWKHRTAAGMSCAVAASLATLCLSTVAYSVQHWRYIQLAISLPSIITLVYVWLIPESVRWLLTTMKVDNAHTAAKRFSRYNKMGLSEQLNRDLETLSKQMSPNAVHMENYGIREILFQGPGLRLTSLVLCFCWFSTSTLYQGLSLMMPDLSGNKYGNMAIVSVAELAGYVVMYFMLTRFGRKKPLAFLLILSGAVCISAVVAENVEKNGGESNTVLTALALIERTCGAACLACLFIYAAEIYPTVVRCFGIGICLFCLQIGCLVAPQILKLGQHTLKSVPWIIFGAIALLAGCLVLLLPETFPMSLPDTMEEAENFLAKKNGRSSKKKNGSVSGESSVTEDDSAAATTDEVGQQANGQVPPPGGGPGGGGTGGGTETGGGQVDGEDEDDDLNRYGKVVRFYGLEAGFEEEDDGDDADDPCHEVRTSKKERIRMVRFSFENEEFRLPRSPSLRAPRFSVIKEEPDLEVAEEMGEGEVGEVSVPEPKAVAVTVVPDGGKKKVKGKKGKKGRKKNTKRATGGETQGNQVQAKQVSRFTVQRVDEDTTSTTTTTQVVVGGEVEKAKVEAVGQRISRFIVQRVAEDSSSPAENNNNNNNNNETGERKLSKEESSSTLVVEEQLASKVAAKEESEDSRERDDAVTREESAVRDCY